MNKTITRMRCFRALGPRAALMLTPSTITPSSIPPSLQPYWCRGWALCGQFHRVRYCSLCNDGPAGDRAEPKEASLSLSLPSVHAAGDRACWALPATSSSGCGLLARVTGIFPSMAIYMATHCLCMIQNSPCMIYCRFPWFTLEVYPRGFIK